MRLYILPLACLVACTNIEKQKGSENFYTWVDERGMLHTQKRSPKTTAKTELNTLNSEHTNEAASASSPATKDFTIIKSEYLKSEDLDKKLAGNRLFSWDENGRQVIAELEVNNKDLITQVNYDNRFKTTLKEYREGKEVLLSEIYSKELKLENFYTTNKRNNSDYLLVELDVSGVEYLVINSYVEGNKVALPSINILNADYQSTKKSTEAFNSYSDETWSTYGRFSGTLGISDQAKYILIRPNPKLGVIETNDGEITLMDLGVIQITN